MKCLLDNEYAPTTFSWGFIDATFETTVRTFLPWTDSIFKHYGKEYETVPCSGRLGYLLESLFPVVSPRTRQMLMETTSQWTAYFDNSAHGGDPISAVPSVPT